MSRARTISIGTDRYQSLAGAGTSAAYPRPGVQGVPGALWRLPLRQAGNVAAIITTPWRCVIGVFHGSARCKPLRKQIRQRKQKRPRKKGLLGLRATRMFILTSADTAALA